MKKTSDKCINQAYKDAWKQYNNEIKSLFIALHKRNEDGDNSFSTSYMTTITVGPSFLLILPSGTIDMKNLCNANGYIDRFNWSVIVMLSWKSSLLIKQY